jgi:hypothetical protein
MLKNLAEFVELLQKKDRNQLRLLLSATTSWTHFLISNFEINLKCTNTQRIFVV